MRRGTGNRAVARALGVLALGALALGSAACGGAGLDAASHTRDPGTHRLGTHHVGSATPATPATTATTGTTGTTGTTQAPATATTAPPVTTATSAPPATGPPETGPPATGPSQGTAPNPSAGRHGPITEPPLPAPGPGFAPGQVTAVGDSVMIDYEGDLAQDIPGVRVTAAVSRWWTTGESILEQLESQDALGAVVIVGLGTNGPVSAAQFDSMMSALSGASRVVFVNLRVDRTWQDANNGVLEQGVARYPRAVLVDWYSVAEQHPTWLYPTQTHLPIDGTGAQALAAMVAEAA